jgi:hypothetical protein
MEAWRLVRLAGLGCMLAALLWIVALLIEYGYNLFPPGSGTLFVANQSMFALAMLGYLLGILGLFRAGAVTGWFGLAVLGLFFAGWCALFLALTVSLTTGSSALDLLVPLGGIGGNLGALLTGIAIVRAGRWRGWQRYAVLVYGLYYLLVLFLPIAIINAEPTLLTETGWALAWLGIGAALFTSDRARARTPTARAGAEAA